MGGLIKVEGYKAFRGQMWIKRPHGRKVVSGDWLYRPDTDCWYCGGCSYPSQICEIKSFD